MMKFLFANKNFTGFIMLALLLGGVAAFFSISKESEPDISLPIVTVQTALPGASAEDVADLITAPIEDQLVGVFSDVNTITSTSRDGVSAITIEFKDGADITKGIRDINSRVDRALSDLPDDATTPAVGQVSFEDEAILQIAIPTNAAFFELQNLADTFTTRLEDVPGVAQVTVQGLPEREIHVIVDALAAESLGVSMLDISNAINAADSTLPVGTVVQNNTRFTASFAGGIESISDLSQVVVATNNGATVRLQDIAVLEDGFSSSKDIITLHADSAVNQQAIVVGVSKQSSADVIVTKRAVDTAISELYQQFNIDTDQTYALFDAGQYILDDIKSLSLTALQTTLLVMLVVLFGLGVSEALVAGVAVPVSFVVSMLVLWVTGNKLNFVTLFSLILVVGLLVDAVVVIVEGITNQMRSKSYLAAAKATVTEFAKPVIAGTATTIAVFLPLFLMSGVTGQFIANIPSTVTVVLLVSLAVALVFIPTLGQKLFTKNISWPKLDAARDKYFTRFTQWYLARLNFFLDSKKRRRRLVLAVIGGFISAIVLLGSGVVPGKFFPDDDFDVLYMDVRFANGTTAEETQAMLQPVINQVLELENTKAVLATVGAPSAFSTASSSGEHYSNLQVLLAEEKQSSEFLLQLQAIAAQINNATASAFGPGSGPSGGTPVGIKLIGNDLEQLLIAAETVRTETQNHPGTIDVNSSLDDVSLELRLNLYRDRIAEAGLTPSLVNTYLRSLVFGLEALDISVFNPITKSNQSVPVMVLPNLATNPSGSWRDISQTTLERVLLQTIPSPAGDVPLDTLVEVTLAPRVPFVAREDGEQFVEVTSFLQPGFFAGAVTEELVANLQKDGVLPDGVRIGIGGEVADTGDSQSELGFVFLAGIALIVLILMAQFNSIRKTLLILSVVPLGLIGVIWGLFILGLPFSFMVALGFIALAGIVVNNSIILIDVMNKLRHDNPVWTARQVVETGATKRLRPILLTTLTTIMGMVPLLFTSPLWQPLALAVICGLAFGVVLTLLMIPSVALKYYRKKN